MTRTVSLPDGQSATLRDPHAVSERQRRPVARAMRGVRPDIMQRVNAVSGMPDDRDGQPTREKAAELQQLQYLMTADEVAAFSDANDFAVVALIDSWSYGTPVTLDALLDLPGRIYDELRKAVAPLVGELFVDTSPSPNAPAPTGASSESAAPSTEAPRAISPTSGESSDSSA